MVNLNKEYNMYNKNINMDNFDLKKYLIENKLNESIHQSLEGLTREEIIEKMDEIFNQIYDEATPEERDKEDQSIYGGKLYDRAIDRFMMVFGKDYYDAISN